MHRARGSDLGPADALASRLRLRGELGCRVRTYDFRHQRRVARRYTGAGWRQALVRGGPDRDPFGSGLAWQDEIPDERGAGGELEDIARMRRGEGRLEIEGGPRQAR